MAAWTFDKAIVSLSSGDGLMCPASGAVVAANVTGTFTVGVEYEDPVEGGSDWVCASASVAITFADGSTLQDGAGFTSGS